MGLPSTPPTRTGSTPVLLVLTGGFVVLQLVSGLLPPYGLFHDEY